ncbi:two component transcriptional regulator, winged helix family protein [Catenovulum agarivorans DS-2]|uniref:Two component transcriptional regulator, winged helix family protein n=1 Tax=Catenovulum agarivorans DS-2 TaxID=1328313 RepID=W7QT09_9ALTE|nr:response regulator transcription factor [Catenovulum agarivorans]EWH11043.1 two component transcriptional regulator, winged helix family protein [Catenovulum agarivorans DS-2]
MQTNILIIDDDDALVELLSEFLAVENFNCTSASNGEEGIAMLKRHSFDLILLDVMMPKMDGFETLKNLRKTDKTPVLMLTARGDDYDRILGLELGADDYLPKPFNHRELLARIKAILRRFDYAKTLSQQAPVQIGQLNIDHNTHSVYINQQAIELTGTEFQFLDFLIRHLGQLISKETLSEQILGRRLMQFDRSIDMHISNLRKKLKEDESIEIKTVRGAGYRLVTHD